MFETIEALSDAIDEGKINADTLAAYVDHNELYVTNAATGEKLFSGVVGPEEVAWLLGITDVNNV